MTHVPSNELLLMTCTTRNVSFNAIKKKTQLKTDHDPKIICLSLIFCSFIALVIFLKQGHNILPSWPIMPMSNLSIMKIITTYWLALIL